MQKLRLHFSFSEQRLHALTGGVRMALAISVGVQRRNEWGGCGMLKEIILPHSNLLANIYIYRLIFSPYTKF